MLSGISLVEYHLREVFVQVERYVMPLIGGDSPHGLSKEENRVLAFQNVNRLNQRIGFLARENSPHSADMRLLQTYVNNLTVGLKSDNTPQIRSSLSSIRNIINSLEVGESKGS